jgi:gas vesicle protein
MAEMEPTARPERTATLRRRILAGGAALALAATGAAWSGCGEDDVSDATDEIDQAVDDANEQADELSQEAQDQVDEATQQAEEEIDQAQEEIDQVQEDAEQGSGGYSP